MSASSIELVEVGPRDGLQAIDTFVPTEVKIELLGELYAAGVRRIEATSFVNAAALPQMADAPEIVAATKRFKDLDASVLVPTVRQAERALTAGATHLVFVISVSEAHNRSNVRRSPAESVGEYERLAKMMPAATRLRLNVATAFDCPMTGPVSTTSVLNLLTDLVPLAPRAEIALCDTTGRASPLQVSQLFNRVAARFSEVEKWAFHGHDTYGLGAANVFAAWHAGVGVIDASCAGLGGCPFAPGATGNVATEDVVWMMELMGVSTGANLGQLCRAANRFATLPGAQTGGRARQALASRAAYLKR